MSRCSPHPPLFPFRWQTWDLVADKCVAELVPAPDVAMRSVSMSMDGSLLIGANASGDVYYWIGGVFVCVSP